MSDQLNLDPSCPPPKRMKITPPIYRLPVELLTKIIDYVPRNQWPALELIDPAGLFREATLLAWGSLREVNMDRDFIHSDPKEVIRHNENNSKLAMERSRRHIARKTESILKKLVERSPLITSLSGVTLMAEDPSLTTMATRYLSQFEHLESISFSTNRLGAKIVNGPWFVICGGIHLSDLDSFIESSQSRATLKVINIERLSLPNDAMDVDHFGRIRAAFANNPNDPTRQVLELDTFSMGGIHFYHHPLTCFDTIDASRMTRLSFGDLGIESAVLTLLINGAPRLQHIDFGFLRSCERYRTTVGWTACHGARLRSNKELLTALESSCPNLVSLGFNEIWSGDDCACHRFESDFKKMLNTIGPQLVNFVFQTGMQPPDMMSEICPIIRNRMPQLKSLKLRECDLNPEYIRGIADLNKDLEEIEFGNCFSNDEIANDILSTNIIAKLPRLKRFVAPFLIPDQRLMEELCKLNDLVELRISASNLTEEQFLAFSRAPVSGANLEVLYLTCLGESAESGLIEFVARAPKLRILELDNVTDRLLKRLADSCPELEKFRARSSDGITFDGVQMLVDRCLKLRWLDVENRTDTVAEDSLGNLRLDRYRQPLRFRW